MTQEDKDLLLKDLCARLPYGVKAKANDIIVVTINGIVKRQSLTGYFDYDIITDNGNFYLKEVKPYLRPMSSMTEEEARDLAILHGYHEPEILSVKVTEKYIDVTLDDGVCGVYTETIWYDEIWIISSIKCFDYLNKKMFDFRGLIPKGLALSTDEYNPYND
jgi:hypothetical protein